MINRLKAFVKKRVTIFIFLIYLFLIVLATPSQMNWWMKFGFWLFSLFLFWVVGVDKKFKVQSSKFKINDWWLLAPLGVLIITRLIIFLKWGAFPLGYDTGIYLKSFETCFSKLSQGGCPGSPFTFISNLLYLFGWQTTHLLTVFYVVLNVVVGLSIYAVAKAYFDKRAAFFSFLFFALSSSQFLAFRAFYWSMMLGLILTLMSFWLLKKKSWLVIPVAGFVGSVHILSFLPLGLTLLFYFLFKGDERPLKKPSSAIQRFLLNRFTGFAFLSGVGILLVALSVNWKTFLEYLPFYTKGFGLIRGYSQYIAQEFKGQFVNFDLYRRFILFYLPFALLAVVRLLKKRRFNHLFFYFLINFAIIYFHLLFYNRFIILLDLVAIVLAGEIVFDFVSQLWVVKLGRVVIILLLLGGIFIAFSQGWQATPLVEPEELNEIKLLSEATEENAFIMVVSAYYSPWVYGFSERRTIAPGLFEYNKWDLLKWMTFWSTSNQELRHQFLDEYEKPLYVFIGDRVGRMDFSNDPAFVKITERIWQYIGEPAE